MEDDGCSERCMRQGSTGTRPLQTIEAKISAEQRQPSQMPGCKGLRITEKRAIKLQDNLNTCINTLTDDLEIYNDMGADDREMCGMMQNGISTISKLWTDIQREFCHALATSVEQADKDRLTASMEDYRTRYKNISTRALQVTAPLFNIMEKERLEREAMRRPPAQGGGGGRGAPKVDESLRPQFKAAFSLSLDEFMYTYINVQLFMF